MASIEWKEIRNCLVARDAVNTWKWFDAFGPNVVKYALNTAGCSTDDTTGMPVDFTYTLVNASTFAHGDVQGGAVILTAGGAEDDGVSLQLGDELGGAGESVSFATDYPTYFAVKFQLEDSDQADFLAGFCITDTALTAGVSDGIYFRTLDASGIVYFVLEQDSVESVTAVDTLADATDLLCEFLYYGHNLYVYADNVLMATIADTDANFPNDELLRLSLEFIDGEAEGNTATVKEFRFIQIQR